MRSSVTVLSFSASAPAKNPSHNKMLMRACCLWMSVASACLLQTAAESNKTFKKVWRLRRETCAPGLYEHNGSCCHKCPAGEFVKSHCSSMAETQCAACPRDTFSNGLSKLRECIRCFNCDTADGFKEVKGCTPSEDSVCECAPGFFCIRKRQIRCRHCQRHSSCESGTGLAKSGTQDEDSSCIPCQSGTFSHGGNTTCQPWQNCTALGMQMTTKGSPFEDATCIKQVTQPAPPPTNHNAWFYCLVGLLVAIVIMLSFWMWKKRSGYSIMGIKCCQNCSPEDASQCQVQQEEGENDLDDQANKEVPTEEVNQTLVTPVSMSVSSLYKLNHCVQETH